MRFSYFLLYFTELTAVLAGAIDGKRSVKDAPCPSLDSWGNCEAAHRVITTIRASTTPTDDISSDFLVGLQKANNGGLLHLEASKSYVIGKKLDLTFLNDVYVRLDGEIKFTDDIEYWQKNNIYHPFQKSISFWAWGGKNIRIYGSGKIDGSGQKWWDGFAGREITDEKNTFFRPVLFHVDNTTNISVEGIRFSNPPSWITFLVRTKNAIFNNFTMDAHSANRNFAKNSDGFDSYNVDGLTITNGRVDVGDDCISAKPNTTNLYVENVWCNNTHGISMGSIGQYPGTLDYISNVFVKNVTLLNGQAGVRLKAWAGKDKGYGYIRNVTYQDVRVENTDYPLVIDQCYINVPASECAKYPSRVNVTDVKFTNIKGSSSGKRGNKVVELKCSPGAECKNIELKTVEIVPGKKSKSSTKGDQTGLKVDGVIICDNISGAIGMPCVSSKDASSGGK